MKDDGNLERETKMYVYIKSEPGLWTVGHYDPAGQWVAESDHGSPDKAASRVAFLNGARADEPRLWYKAEGVEVERQ